jgi:hypothetical protein
MSYFEELTQRIEEILESDVYLSEKELSAKDFSAMKHEAAREYELAIEEKLTAAVGFEYYDDEIEAAYSFDKAGRCLDKLIHVANITDVGLEHDVSPVYAVYAKIKERAARKFKAVAERVSKYKEDAGYCFLRAAKGYALSGDVDKAKETLEEADSTFNSTDEQDNYSCLRQMVIATIEEQAEKLV